MIDFKRINSECLPIFRSLAQSWIPGGRMEGAEYVVANPTRLDKTPGSFKINTVSGTWKDFANGDGGNDCISLYAYIYGIKPGEAAEKISQEIRYTPHEKTPQKPKDEWVIVSPIPENYSELPKERKYKVGEDWKADKIEKYYKYCDADGDFLGFTALCRKEDGTKDVIPYRYCRNESGKFAWKQKGFSAPRPLYNQEALKTTPQDAQILLVEGEKCCNYAKKIFADYPRIVPLTWIGGANSAKLADYTPIFGRKVIFWADADAPGEKAMRQIFDIVKTNIKGGKLILPTEKPQGWDIADFINDGATQKTIIDFMRENMLDFTDPVPETAITPVIEPPEYFHRRDCPFQFLGFNSAQGTTVYYYLPRGTHKVTELAAAAHSKANLISLANKDWFEGNFPTKTGWCNESALNWMIRESEKVGIYDPTKIRGRGAWFDRDRAVLHLGDRLIVDNETVNIDEIKSEYIYESGIPIEGGEFSVDNILSAEDASTMLKISDLLSWQQPISAKLYAGWLVLAPICGAIDWRPHLWLTGESGTGKTWIQENITAPILGDCCVNCSSNTTEPGIRQNLCHDAFPVVFDEIETEDNVSFNRVQNIIELARQASSNKNSNIFKGSSSGKSISYAVRSPFLFSSINPKLVQQADKNRITTLKLKKRTDSENERIFGEIVDLVTGVVTKEWAARLRGRSIFMIPTIKKNIEIFSRVMSRILKSKRHGDQIGTLLAGAWSLKSDGVIDFEVAEKFCCSVKWEEETELESTTDHDQCLSIIMQQLIPVNGHSDKRAVGDLLKDALADTVGITDPTEQTRIRDRALIARDALRKYGISTISNRSGGMDIAIAENHTMLSGLLSQTPWHSSYKHVLMRIEGCFMKTAVFADQQRSRAICIPAKNKFVEDDFLDNIVEMF
jgi:putative DNA primase/helicase